MDYLVRAAKLPQNFWTSPRRPLQGDFQQFAGEERAGVQQIQGVTHAGVGAWKVIGYSRGDQGPQTGFMFRSTHDDHRRIHRKCVNAESSCTGWPPPCKPDSSANKTTPGAASSMICSAVSTLLRAATRTSSLRDSSLRRAGGAQQGVIATTSMVCRASDLTFIAPHPLFLASQLLDSPEKSRLSKPRTQSFNHLVDPLHFGGDANQPAEPWPGSQMLAEQAVLQMME